MSSKDRVEGSYLSPSLEHALVSDAMRPQVLTCPPDASLRTVARMMAAEHVHSAIVSDAGSRGKEGQAWGIVSDMDLLRAANEDMDERTASWAAVSEFLSVAPDERLARAVQKMIEHDVTHLVVVDPASDRAVGVLAWGRA